jgi:hypothetical protein
MNEFSGIVAGMVENNKYYIKVWIMKYKDQIEETLKKYENS